MKIYKYNILNTRYIWTVFILFLSLIQIPDLSSQEINLEDLSIAENYLKEKKFPEAERIASSILTREPSNPRAEFVLTRAWIGIGSMEKERNNYEEAKRYYRKALERWPLHSDVRTELIRLESQYPSKTGNRTGKISHSTEKEILAVSESIRQEMRTLRDRLQFPSLVRDYRTYFYWIYAFLGIIAIELFFLFRKR